MLLVEKWGKSFETHWKEMPIHNQLCSMMGMERDFGTGKPNFYYVLSVSTDWQE